MYTVKIIDKEEKIGMLKWEGMVKATEIDNATADLKELHKEFGDQKYYLMVDVKDLKVFSPDAKEKIVEQQKWIKSSLHVSAVVMDKKLIERQLKELGSRSSTDEIEIFFPAYEEALAYLEELASKKSS
ncbi:STAS/SEC14 domain-containing protein [Lentibacillus sediminis]|uniref:STAS/SEC14 domain-containing protein n=1 Tax=Lentibacillus sediminis TaxID=1940529 RepID=UPI00117B4336|nr:STAS/SEC14 domain-containing protein [Lentibacillus sediminis]